jgi:hypothetical protein
MQTGFRSGIQTGQNAAGQGDVDPFDRVIHQAWVLEHTVRPAGTIEHPFGGLDLANEALTSHEYVLFTLDRIVRGSRQPRQSCGTRGLNTAVGARGQERWLRARNSRLTDFPQVMTVTGGQ